MSIGQASKGKKILLNTENIKVLFKMLSFFKKKNHSVVTERVKKSYKKNAMWEW